jgi:hypothetical protein
MGRRKVNESPIKRPAAPPGRTPEARENQLISLAYDLVEERLRNGTATSAETVAILRLGTQKEKLERELNEKKIALMEAKTEALQSAKRVEELYGAAIEAMRRYSGAANMEYDEDDDLY